MNSAAGRRSILPFVLLCALAAPPVLAAQQHATSPTCDTTNIRWVLPGDFATAQRRARAEHRLILVKGISFGVDDAGARCATDGTW